MIEIFTGCNLSVQFGIGIILFCHSNETTSSVVCPQNPSNIVIVRGVLVLALHLLSIGHRICNDLYNVPLGSVLINDFHYAKCPTHTFLYLNNTEYYWGLRSLITTCSHSHYVSYLPFVIGVCWLLCFSPPSLNCWWGQLTTSSLLLKYLHLSF